MLDQMYARREALSGLDQDQIRKVALAWHNTIRRRGKLLFCGNGGSAAIAQHLAAECVVRLRAGSTRPAIAAIALSADTAVLTAAGNDLGFEQIFSRQIEALAQPGDLLVPLTTSGRSANITTAIVAALGRDLDVTVFAGSVNTLPPFMGHSRMIDVVEVPSDDTAIIQECHLAIGHMIMGKLEEALSP